MYKYAKLIRDGKLDFLNKYVYSEKLSNKNTVFNTDEFRLFYSFISDNYVIDEEYNNVIKEMYDSKYIKFNDFVDNFISYYSDKIFGNVNILEDVYNDKLSFVKRFLMEFDVICSLYDTYDIDNYNLKILVGNRLNNLLYCLNIFKYEKLDYLDEGDRDRVDVDFNYLFSMLEAITIINHDKEKKFRDLLFNGSNNYEDILSNINVDDNNIEYEDEFYNFIYNYELYGALNLKKFRVKKFKKY